MLEEMSVPENPKSEATNPSNTGPDSAAADGASASSPVSPNLNASGDATEGEDAKRQPNTPSNNQRDSAAAGESLSSPPVSPDLNIPRDRTKNLSIIKPRRATGPRTKEGKDRSKRNAVKQGIFSRVVWRDPVFDKEFGVAYGMISNQKGHSRQFLWRNSPFS